MSRFDHVIRVARLLQKLEQSRAGIPVSAIAAELEVSERTAYRYLEALQRAEYPLEQEGGRYRLPRSGQARLTLDEQRQLKLLALAGYPLQGSPLMPRVEAIISRLGDQTPRQGNLLGRLRLPLTRGQLAIDYGAHEGTLRTLLKASDERRTVDARYFTASRNQETERQLDPYDFHYDASLEALYLFAYCHLRGGVRIFAAHRFRAVELTRRPFRRAPDFDAGTFLRGAFRVYRGAQATPVRLLFAAGIATRVVERTWHRSQTVHPRPGGAVELGLTLDGLEEIVPFVLSYGASVEVLAPPELAERVAAAHLAASGLYESPRRPARRAARRPRPRRTASR